MPNKSVIQSQYINGSEVFLTGQGAILQIEQVVDLVLSGEGRILEIEQKVEAVSPTISLAVTQVVSAVLTGLDDKVARYGWDVALNINGSKIPNTQISGNIKIQRIENEAASMMFVLYPQHGTTLDLRGYEGKPVYCNITTSDGLFRAYTGVISTVDVDFNSRMISFICTDNRDQKVNSAYGSYIKGIGYYDNSQRALNPAEELSQRLETVMYAFDFDASGNPALTSLYAKSSPDYTFTSSQVSYDAGRDPKVTLATRSRLVNTVFIDYKYRYKRMHHAECTYTWVLNATNIEFLTEGISVPRRDVIEAAVSGTGWPLRGDIGYTPVLPAGFYNVNAGGQVYHVGVSWTQATYAVGNATTTDSNGNTVNVVDDNGNVVKKALMTSATDYSNLLCFGAAFTLSKQYSQDISENYTLTVVAQDSVNRFGVVSQSQSGGVDSQYDDSGWNDYKFYKSPPTDVPLVYEPHNRSYYWNETTSLAAYQNGIYTALNRAYTTIRKSHRENRASFSTPKVKPQLQLSNTIYLNTTSAEDVTIQAKGKVYSITHYLSPQTTESYTTVELAISVNAGGSSPTAISVPSRPSNNLLPFTQAVGMSSHYGQEPQRIWTGWIANKWVNSRVSGGFNWQRTTYPESFVIDTPTIPASYTQVVNLPVAASYGVSIVNDVLNVVI